MNNNFHRLALVLAASLGLAVTAVQAADPLRAYNVDIRQTSVSGLSSGGYMAVQLGVAFSSLFIGVGAIAAGPYYCAQGNIRTAVGPCAAASEPIDVARLVDITNDNADAETIDPVSNLANQRIWLFSGAADTTVRPPVTHALESFYRSYVSSSNLFYERHPIAEHAMPTENYGNQCTVHDEPFINDCDYDGAGNLLKWLYGALNPKATAALTGSFVEFDQSEFIRNPKSHSMANTGWLYVPANCASGAPCKLHVAIHGCRQYPAYTYRQDGVKITYGTTFVKNAGYNEWADTNSMIVVYPQTQRTTRWFWDIYDLYNANPRGCWDWWGYDDPNYAKKSGRQMEAIKKMIDRIASGRTP